MDAALYIIICINFIYLSDIRSEVAWMMDDIDILDIDYDQQSLGPLLSGIPGFELFVNLLL